MMDVSNRDFESACREHVARFFAMHPNAELEERVQRAVRFLRLSDRPLAGKTEGWAAGIIYAMSRDGRPTYGVPGIQNRDFEAIMGVSMETTRKRAAYFQRLAAI